MYFANHEGNNFVAEHYHIVPKWSQITKKDRKIAVKMLSNKIARTDKEYIRYYGNLAWLNFGLPKTLDNYEHTLHNLFFAVTWKRLKEPDKKKPDEKEPDKEKPDKDYIGFSRNDGDFYDGLDEDEISYLQHSYLLLAKLVYLPFLYGYNMSCVMNCRKYLEVKDHLEKVRNK